MTGQPSSWAFKTLDARLSEKKSFPQKCSENFDPRVKVKRHILILCRCLNRDVL